VRRSLEGVAAFSGRALMFGGGVALAGIAAVGYGLKKAADAGSDLNETVNKAKEVFGASFDVVNAGAEKMAKTFGVPKKEFIDGAASIGLIAKAAGQSEKQAAKMGSQFSELAGDVASFYNIPVAEALQKIEAGLVGQVRPLRELGVLLSEDAIKQEALNLGIKKGKGELDESQKVMARASLIARGLSTAQGDLARTAGGAANRTREFWGRLQNTLAEVGTTLQPVFETILGAASQALGAIGGFFQRNQEIVKSWADNVQMAINGAGVVIRNWSTVVQIAALETRQAFTNIGEIVQWMMGIAKSHLDWLGRNWLAVFKDIAMGTMTILNNIGLNLRNFFSALFEAMKNPAGGFNFDWKPLLVGFKATMQALPNIAAPVLTNLNGQIAAVLGKGLMNELGVQINKAGGEEAGKRGAVKPAGENAKQEKGAGKTQDLAEFALSIQTAALGMDKDKIPKEQLTEMQKLVKLAEEARDKNRAAGNEMAAALWAGPA